MWSARPALIPATFLFFDRLLLVEIQWEGQIQNNIRNKQHINPNPREHITTFQLEFHIISLIAEGGSALLIIVR